MTTNNYYQFPDWLESELRRQGLIPAQLAQKIGKPNATITRILNSERRPKAETLNKIADALDLPRIDVYKAAGLIVEENYESEIVSRISFRIKKLSPEHQKIVDAFIDTLLNIGVDVDKEKKQIREVE